ncbi:lysine exporter LysO family protein [Dysgonomonas sp. Marseille-P4677]|uniref:lysine exporter LysO family protein n=1 Tax=Dysgonomonas sp. Marseille-P4677 TaxID=2364790 RepID=UPI0019131B20|nr:lysine exporter LysO family protein [Dysgonomonas sp. Marseille-P4677]MBK5720727.1 lysine exporter LysO family protein [Dysgonomonas sp. Marseille-P4677]
MKGSLIILAFFIAGAVSAYVGILPDIVLENDFSVYILYGLMLLVGINIGYDKKTLSTLKNNKFKVILVPLATLVGTLIGCAIIGLFIPKWSVFECMAVGSGFGYYSLSSIFITQYKGAELGTIALVSNIIRELFTLLAAPILVTYFGKLAPISAGGATTMDTTLPIITKYSGQEFIIIAIFHGITLDLTVPFLVTFFCYL